MAQPACGLLTAEQVRGALAGSELESSPSCPVRLAPLPKGARAYRPHAIAVEAARRGSVPADISEVIRRSLTSRAAAVSLRDPAALVCADRGAKLLRGNDPFCRHCGGRARGGGR